MNIRFDGKTALVTGAGKGIGRVLALKLIETGANVIAVSRTLSDLESLKNEKDHDLQGSSPYWVYSESVDKNASETTYNPEKIQIICLDIGDWEKTKRVLENIGPVDLLVNNAAIAAKTDVGNITEEDVDRMFNINTKAIINITQLIANGMKSRGKGGSIVNVSSVAGIYASPDFGIYSATKGAIQAWTLANSAEFGPHKIRVNTVNPTAVRTPMLESVGVLEEGNEFGKAILSRTPLRRIAEPEDVVYPILFLLSDYASMITGVTLPIDGGLGVCFI